MRSDEIILGQIFNSNEKSFTLNDLTSESLPRVSYNLDQISANRLFLRVSGIIFFVNKIIRNDPSADCQTRTLKSTVDLCTIYRALMGIKMTMKLIWFSFWPQ